MHACSPLWAALICGGAGAAENGGAKGCEEVIAGGSWTAGPGPTQPGCVTVPAKRTSGDERMDTTQKANGLSQRI